MPCEPTDAMPGTEEKICVLMERVALGQELFHEDDPYQEVRELAMVG